MKEGIVEVGFIKGKPILGVETLNQYVYDAGFTARQIKAEFVGRLIQATDGSYRFEVTETDQTFPVEANAVMKESPQGIGQEVILIALAQEDPNALMRLAPEQIQPKEAARYRLYSPFSSGVEGKVITPSAEKGENKVYIRADGLASSRQG